MRTWKRFFGGLVALGLALPLASAGCSTPADDSMQPPPTASRLTYVEDAKPILDHYCGDCHVAGGIGPFALSDYAQVKGRGRGHPQSGQRRSHAAVAAHR